MSEHKAGEQPQEERFDLLTANPVYKPFRYPWAYDAWLTQQRVHWLPEEVPLADDVKDWHRVLNESERHLVTQIFRFFTQSDVEVNNCYMKHYSRVFKPTEVLMMLSAFSNIETIHIAAYSHLLDTLGMPEEVYSAFLKYKEMKSQKHWQLLVRLPKGYSCLLPVPSCSTSRALTSSRAWGRSCPGRCGTKPCIACPLSACSACSFRKTRISGPTGCGRN
jgi:hypothetical protein